MNETITGTYYLTIIGAIIIVFFILILIFFAITFRRYRRIFGEVLRDLSIALLTGIIVGASINKELLEYSWLILALILSLILGIWLKEKSSKK